MNTPRPAAGATTVKPTTVALTTPPVDGTTKPSAFGGDDTKVTTGVDNRGTLWVYRPASDKWHGSYKSVTAVPAGSGFNITPPTGFTSAQCMGVEIRRISGTGETHESIFAVNGANVRVDLQGVAAVGQYEAIATFVR